MTILIGKAVTDWCVARMRPWTYVPEGREPAVIVLDGTRDSWTQATAYDRAPSGQGGLKRRWVVGPRPEFRVTSPARTQDLIWQESYGAHFSLDPEPA